MKKRIAFLFAALIALSLAACNSNNETISLSTTPEVKVSPSRDITDVPAEALAENSPPQTVTDQPSAQISEQEKAYILEELDYLAANRPKLLISCTVCGGDGKLDTPCDKCGGSGQTAIPGITMFAAFAPCTGCTGSGYQTCSQCTWGLMSNPNYNLESENWTEQRHALWGQLSYSTEKIKRMEMDEAQAYIDARSDVGGNRDTITTVTVPGICKTCYGSGKCHTCGGDGFYQNPYTGEQQSCPNCRTRNGLCWACGGTGEKN